MSEDSNPIPDSSPIARREFLKAAGAVAAAAAATSVASKASGEIAPTKHPNILVFLTDDHGQWAQHAYGNSELQTPHLDRLSARGTRMVNAFTPCPVCSPARASFFTGRMPSQHGIHDWLDHLKNSYEHPWLHGQTLLSELLQSAGYHTGLVGKWHCGHDREPQPGFDRWFTYWGTQYPHNGKQSFSDQGKEVTEQGQQSPFFTKQAIDFLESRKKDAASAEKPFFLYVSYVDTHSPHDAAPEELVAMYVKATFKDIPNESFAPCHGKVGSGKAVKPEMEHKRLAEYYGAASAVDREVGQVIAALEAAGELDNTLIVYTGDHGLNTGHHGIWEKGNATTPQNFLDESIRIACTLAWPAGGIATGQTVDSFVNHCDLFATLLDVAGVQLDASTAQKINSPGRSYLPALRGNPIADWRTEQICEYGNARMIRTATHKLILRYPYKDVRYPNELYDLKTDPRETINQFENAAYAPVIETLTKKLDAYFEKYSVPEHDGRHLEDQPPATAASPWLRGIKKK
jgi:arylsulfatase A-like enzyme